MTRIPHASRTSVEMYYVRRAPDMSIRYSIVATYPLAGTALRTIPLYSVVGTVGIDLFINQSGARRAALRLANPSTSGG